MRTAVEVEDLFFPEEVEEVNDNSKATQEEEMFARTTLDTLNPYRPNVSSYDQDYAKEFKHSGKKIDFNNALAFTGEDEKFAYKRAVSRIKEMVGSDYWRSMDTWVPTYISLRPWEDGMDDKDRETFYNNMSSMEAEEEIITGDALSRSHSIHHK